MICNDGWVLGSQLSALDSQSSGNILVSSEEEGKVIFFIKK